MPQSHTILASTRNRFHTNVHTRGTLAGQDSAARLADLFSAHASIAVSKLAAWTWRPTNQAPVGGGKAADGVEAAGTTSWEMGVRISCFLPSFLLFPSTPPLMVVSVYCLSSFACVWVSWTGAGRRWSLH